MGKDENIAFRTSSETKQILERLAKEGYRSLSQQCEMIVLDWLKQKGCTELKEEEPIIPKALKGLIDSGEKRVIHYRRDLPAKNDLKRKK
jgi:hypothetical protein